MKVRHQILDKLGSGGFGCVYKALDTQLDREVAIKRLKAESYVDHIELKEQMLSEAKILAGLRHPNIVSIYDVIDSDTGGDIVMELIEGSTLDQVISKGPLKVEQFLFVATQLLSAMATAHEHNILHCDLKPSNIMLSDLEDGNYHATVLDFGMSPSKDEEPKTKTGAQRLVGSIYFMAPEIIESGITSPESDIYSLGCLFYYMLTGHHPFDGECTVTVMASHMRNAFIPIQQHKDDLPDSLSSWIESHIQHKPEDRISSCRDSLNSLLKLEDLKPLETLAEVYPNSDFSNTMLHSLSSLTKVNVKISDKQKEEFAKSKRTNPSITPADQVPLEERVQQVRPENLWYFSIDDVRKGPVHFSKVCELIAEGFIRSNDPIYQHRIGQWTPAIQIPEFKDEFQAAKVMPPRPKRKKKISLRNSARVRAQKAIAKAAQVRVTREEVKPFPTEITTVITVCCLVSAVLLWNIDFWQQALLAASLMLVLSSLILTRIRMNQHEARWIIPAVFIPVLTDAIFALLRPKLGAQSFTLMLLGLGLFTYTATHRYANDVISQLHLDGLSEWLHKLTEQMASL